MGTCDSIQAGLDGLRRQRDNLQQALNAIVGGDPGSLQDKKILWNEIQNLEQLINATSAALQACLKNPPPPPPIQTSNLRIVNVEVTQSIQYWTPPPAQGSSFQPSNSIPLVAKKQTVLRAYVDAGNDSRFPTPGTITGTVRLARSSGPPLTLSPINAPIQAQPIGNIQRGNVNHTLNFLIPASACIGNMEVYVTVFDSKHSGDPAYTSLQFVPGDSEGKIYFVPMPALPVHGVLVHYTGLDYYGNKVDATPTGLDLVATLESFLHRSYPIAEIDYTGCQILEWSERNSTNQGINDLKNKVDDLRANSGTNDIYVGLYPVAAGCGAICGLGGGGTAVTVVGNGPEAAHEIGHALGMQHVPCPNQSAADPFGDYPTYDSFPQGSIGEFGFDTVAMQVFDPNVFFDLMSYCQPVWISPYIYLKLSDSIKNGYASAGASSASFRRPLPSPRQTWYEQLHIGLRVYRDDTVDIRSASQSPGPCSSCRAGGTSDLALELVGAQGELIEFYRCRQRDPHSDPDGPYIDLFESVRFTDDLAELRLVRGKKILRSLKVASNSPTITIEELRHLKKEPHLVRVAWRAEAANDSEPPLTYVVRYSHDGSKTWRAVATGLKETHHVLNLSLMPGGEGCLIQVAASAGLRTATAVSEPFSTPRKPRVAYLVAPKPDETYSLGEPIPLFGGGFSPDFGTTPFDDVAWTTPAIGSIGTGIRAAARDLPLGEHRITVHVPDGLGGEAQGTVRIKVVSSRMKC